MSWEPPKPLDWVGSSRSDYVAFPELVQQRMGYALYLAQIGNKHESVKPLKGFGGAGVLEVAEDHAGDTYRAVYTIRFVDVVYVLHAFQKKSRRGQATPKAEIDLIKRRLQAAEADFRTHYAARQA